MLSIVNKVQTPFGGNFIWKDPNGFEVKANNWNTLLQRVQERLVAIGGFVGEGHIEAIEHQVCEQMGLHCVDKTRPEPRERTFSDWVQFGQVVSRHMDQGGQLVSPEEAERRAEICAMCPQNRPIGGCASCKASEMASWLYRIIRGRATSKDGLLTSCSVCGCALTLSVHVPLDAQKDERFKPEDFPGHCWKRNPSP